MLYYISSDLNSWRYLQIWVQTKRTEVNLSQSLSAVTFKIKMKQIMLNYTYLLKKIKTFRGKVLQYTIQTMGAWAKCKQTNHAVNELIYLEKKSLIRELLLRLVSCCMKFCVNILSGIKCNKIRICKTLNVWSNVTALFEPLSNSGNFLMILQILQRDKKFLMQMAV